MLAIKLAQDTDIYKYDLLSGPTKRERQNTQLLERKARWCWIHKCFNNIYFRNYNISKNEKQLADKMFSLIKKNYINEHA